MDTNNVKRIAGRYAHGHYLAGGITLAEKGIVFERISECEARASYESAAVLMNRALKDAEELDMDVVCVYASVVASQIAETTEVEAFIRQSIIGVIIASRAME